MSRCRMAGCRGFGKQSQEKFSLAVFLNPTSLLTEGTCLDFPTRVLPSLVILTPLHTPHVQKQRCRKLWATLWEEELRHIPTKGCRQMGSVPSSATTIQPRQRDPPSLCQELSHPRDSPAHRSGSFPVTYNRGQQGGSRNDCVFSHHNF